MLSLRPIPIKKTIVFNSLIHHRLPALQGAMWATSILERGNVVGVAIVGRPTARQLDDNCEILQVVRCAVIQGTPNGCSMFYGSCSRAARSLGAIDMLTYIHSDEEGVSLKAAGWILDEEFTTRAEQWSRVSREREPSVEPGEKKRYWVPWGAWAQARG